VQKKKRSSDANGVGAYSLSRRANEGAMSRRGEKERPLRNNSAASLLSLCLTLGQPSTTNCEVIRTHQNAKSDFTNPISKAVWRSFSSLESKLVEPRLNLYFFFLETFFK
jgi:hypothetical protein